MCNSPAPTDGSIEYLIQPQSRSKDSTKGIMFTIRARHDITVTGFDIPPKRSKSCNMQVYTKKGDYRYFKDGLTEGWSTLFDKNMKLNTKRLEHIQADKGDGVFIPKWKIQSFIIYCNRG